MSKATEKDNVLTANNILLLIIAVAVYSLSGLLSKQASRFPFLSWSYTGFLIGVIVVLGIYAILWQYALKRVPLNKAYLFRSVGLVFGLTIAFFFFHEVITWANIMGSGIILCGLIILLDEKRTA